MFIREKPVRCVRRSRIVTKTSDFWILENIMRSDTKAVKDNRKQLMVNQSAAKVAEMIQNSGNQPDFCLVKETIMKNIWRLPRRPPEFPDKPHEAEEASLPRRST